MTRYYKTEWKNDVSSYWKIDNNIVYGFEWDVRGIKRVWVKCNLSVKAYLNVIKDNRSVVEITEEEMILELI